MKTVAAIIFLITRSLADGIRLFATALVISVVTGVPVPWTVISLGAAMIIYTVRGGVSAVIWTDVVQMFVYIAVALVVFFALWSRIPGGWSEVMSAGAAAGKFVVLDLSWSPATIYTLWAGIIGGIALTLATHGTDQFLVQRLLSARSAREASLGLVLSGFVVFAQFVLFLLIGVMLFVYHQHVAAPVLRRMDEILPLFIVNHLSGGVAGFIVAAIVAAALSPSLNAMAATTVNDFYKRYVRPDADERRLMRISRQATIAWGAVQLAVALGAQWMDRSVLDAAGGAVADERAGAGLFGGRADGPHRFACDARGHGARDERPGVGLGERRRRVDLVRLHRRLGHRTWRRDALAARSARVTRRRRHIVRTRKEIRLSSWASVGPPDDPDITSRAVVADPHLPERRADGHTASDFFGGDPHDLRVVAALPLRGARVEHRGVVGGLRAPRVHDLGGRHRVQLVTASFGA